MTREACAIVAGALNRPDASTRRVLIGEANRCRVTACARLYRALRDNSARRCDNDREDVLVAMCVDADHEVQLVCKHPSDPPTRLVGSGNAGLSTGKPRRQDCDESRPKGGQAPD